MTLMPSGIKNKYLPKCFVYASSEIIAHKPNAIVINSRQENTPIMTLSMFRVRLSNIFSGTIHCIAANHISKIISPISSNNKKSPPWVYYGTPALGSTRARLIIHQPSKTSFFIILLIVRLIVRTDLRLDLLTKTRLKPTIISFSIFRDVIFI